LASALIGILAGLVLLAHPGSGAVSLTLVLTAFFFAEAVASIMFALAHRRQLRSWGLLAAGGVLELVLAVVVLAGLPGTAAWVLGLLVGIDLLFAGVLLAMVALHARKGVGAGA
jgi:uncharacterized membrane protein HdeD (DUF308 family)